ncbi:copper transporter 1-like [Bidens hawaiensis]|uniref:copper transporter 1-like n=1 Tax=Bidens hawaiensis TaxID=980011 RepID=UPI00404B41C2
MALPPMMHGANATMGGPRKQKTMMHMTFYLGKDALILFKGWPGTSTGMYALALVFVFFLALLVEWLAHCNLKMTKFDVAGTGMAQTLVYTIRVGLGFMVMLAIMSFNVGVFLAAVSGHALGFFFFRVVMKPANSSSDALC